MTVEKKETPFDDLLKALQETADQAETLAKAQTAAPDDKKVAAAAAEGEGEVNPEDELEEEGEGEGKTFGKSVAATDAEGNPVEAIDATDLIKSLIGRLDSTDGTLAKSLGALTGIVSKQNDLIKSMQGQIKDLSGQGRGRKTVVSMIEKPGITDLAKSQEADEKITPQELMAKANTAWSSQKISGAELSIVDSCIRNREPISAAILQKIALA